jgi:hypothetical protein
MKSNKINYSCHKFLKIVNTLHACKNPAINLRHLLLQKGYIIRFLVIDQRAAQFFTMNLFLFLTLYMFRAHRANHQERQIVSTQPLFRPAHDTATE